MSDDVVILRMRLRECKDSLNAMVQMAEEIKRQTSKTREILYLLGWEFCGAEFDRLQKGGTNLSKLRAEELYAIVRPALQKMKTVADFAGSYPAQIAELEKSVERWKAEARRADEVLNKAHQTFDELRRENEALKRALQEAQARKPAAVTSEAPVPVTGETDVPQPPAISAPAQTRPAPVSSVSPDDWDAWYETVWEPSRTRKSDEAIITCVGSSGAFRLSDIQEETGLSETTLYRRIRALRAAGLIDAAEGASLDGRPSRDIVLTEEGRRLYKRMTGEDPVESTKKLNKRIVHVTPTGSMRMPNLAALRLRLRMARIRYCSS